MDPRLTGLADILRLNTRLFRNCLADLTDEQARVRPSERTNNAAFVAAHVVDSRYYLLKALHAARTNPLAEYLEQVRRLEDVTRWPTLAVIAAAWADASHAVRDRMETLTAAELEDPPGAPLPGSGSLLEALAFMVQHDSYHIGQLALLRSHAGLPAMSYD